MTRVLFKPITERRKAKANTRVLFDTKKPLCFLDQFIKPPFRPASQTSDIRAVVFHRATALVIDRLSLVRLSSRPRIPSTFGSGWIRS